MKRIIFTVLIFVLLGCEGYGPNYRGFTFLFYNSLDTKFYDTKVYIGSLDADDKFIASDSIFIEAIELEKNGFEFYGENKWKPNLDKIQTIPSNEALFMIELSNGRKEIVKRYNEDKYFSVDISNGINSFENEAGNVYFGLFNDKFYGSRSKDYQK